MLLLCYLFDRNSSLANLPVSALHIFPTNVNNFTNCIHLHDPPPGPAALRPFQTFPRTLGDFVEATDSHTILRGEGGARIVTQYEIVRANTGTVAEEQFRLDHFEITNHGFTLKTRPA